MMQARDELWKEHTHVRNHLPPGSPLRGLRRADRPGLLRCTSRTSPVETSTSMSSRAWSTRRMAQPSISPSESSMSIAATSRVLIELPTEADSGANRMWIPFRVVPDRFRSARMILSDREIQAAIRDRIILDRARTRRKPLHLDSPRPHPRFGRVACPRLRGHEQPLDERQTSNLKI